MTANDQAAAAGPAAAGAARKGPRVLLALLALLLIVLFAGLGTWQVIRLQWKLDLIARVEQRVHAAPVAPPPSARWERVTA
jgi:surfeit locus 1 family protein